MLAITCHTVHMNICSQIEMIIHLNREVSFIGIVMEDSDMFINYNSIQTSNK